MPRLAFATAFSALWFMSSVVRLPLVWYLPLAHRFVWATTVTELGIDFFGKLALSAVGGATAALIASRLRPPERVARLLTAWVLVTFAFALALNVTQLVKRVPVPLSAAGDR